VGRAVGLAVAVGDRVGRGLGLPLGPGPVVLLGAGLGLTAAVMFVVIRVVQVTTLPPGLAVPLHWLTVTGIAALIVDGSTVQCTVPPPPLPEPLHWVTVAAAVVAGNGEHTRCPPPPVAEPTHWFDVAADTGFAPGVSALMLSMISTVQVTGPAASLSEPLHWLTVVTRSVEVWGTPAGAHGLLWQVADTVVVELVRPPLMVLTMRTVQAMEVVAPPGPGPIPLHWLAVRFAAAADGTRSTRPPAVNSRVTAATTRAAHRHRCRRSDGGAPATVAFTRSPRAAAH